MANVFNVFRYRFGKPDATLLFVIGTGRSGTHWLAKSIRSHPDIRATIESRPMFGLSTRMALDPKLEDSLFENLVSAYRRQLRISYPKTYLDKSHPNIWIAEKLKDAFPKALFLGIERDPYATVASMIKHDGVSAWHTRWKEFPVPNRFLGITPEIAARYEEMPFASKCALRWLSHRDRMAELRATLGDSLLFVQYEAFADDPARILREARSFAGLKTPIPVPDVNRESLSKWRSDLSHQQVRDIQDIVGFPPS